VQRGARAGEAREHGKVIVTNTERGNPDKAKTYKQRELKSRAFYSLGRKDGKIKVEGTI